MKKKYPIIIATISTLGLIGVVAKKILFRKKGKSPETSSKEEKSKIKSFFLAAIPIIIALLTLFVTINRESIVFEIFGELKVAHSRVLPRTASSLYFENEVQYYKFLQENKEIDEMKGTHEKAFLNRDLFKSKKPTTSTLMGLELGMQSINYINEPRIDVFSGLRDDSMHIYMVNNSDSILTDNTSVEFFFSYSIDASSNDKKAYDFNSLFYNDELVLEKEIPVLQGGEILELFSFKINKQFKQQLKARNEEYLLLFVETTKNDVSEIECIGAIMMGYDGTIDLMKEQGGADPDSATFILDLDIIDKHMPYSVSIQHANRLNGYLNIGDKSCIDLMVIPDKTCEITFSLIYHLYDDELYEIKTENKTVRTVVPIYNDDRGYYYSLVENLMDKKFTNYICNKNDIFYSETKYDRSDFFESINQNKIAS